MRLKPLVGVVLLAALGGCSASQCDPNQANLFTGIGCAVGNGYSTRTAILNTQNNAAQTGEQSALQQTEAAQQADNDAQTRLAALQAKLADMNNTLEQDQADLARVQGTTATQRQEIADLQSRIAALKNTIAAQSQAPNDAQVQAVERQKQKIELQKQALLATMANQ